MGSGEIIDEVCEGLLVLNVVIDESLWLYGVVLGLMLRSVLKGGVMFGGYYVLDDIVVVM